MLVTTVGSPNSSSQQQQKSPLSNGKTSDSRWVEIESDPGIFTELIERMGAKGVQVEEVWSFDEEAHRRLDPYGYIFLFKYTSQHDARSGEYPAPAGVTFSNQIIQNACATQAVLSILVNKDDEIDVGPQVKMWKEFTAEFTPSIRGLAISNSPIFKDAHNSFARPAQTYETTGVSTDDSEVFDVFHYVSYVPIKGTVYELDGLKRGPVNLGNYKDNDWFPVVEPVIRGLFSKYGGNIQFSLLAMIKDRRIVLRHTVELLNDEMVRRETNSEKIGDPTVASQDEEGSGLRKYSNDNIDPEKKVSNEEGLERNFRDMSLEELQAELKIKMLDLEEEHQKRKNYEEQNSRRRFNYFPFIMRYLEILAKKSQFWQLITNASPLDV